MRPLRVLLFTYGIFCLISGIYFISKNVNLVIGIYFLVNATVIFIGTLFDRRYKSKNLRNQSHKPTGEKFLDPKTGEVVEVHFDPKTGERSYISEKN